MTPEIITETDDYFVINKPAGMAVEAPSHEKTLRDWLIEHGKIKVGEWDEKNRYGVVHRLDSDTSGVIIWAKTPAAQEKLKLLWQGRQVEKTYLALVTGETEPAGTIELALERDNKNDRQKAVMLRSPKSRPAVTTYKRLAVGEWDGEKISLLEVRPITGRTHQIRVHLKAIGHPIIGDKLYGEKLGDQLAKKLALERQFLHARQIELDNHEYCAALSLDLLSVLEKVRIPEPLP